MKINSNLYPIHSFKQDLEKAAAFLKQNIKKINQCAL